MLEDAAFPRVKLTCNLVVSWLQFWGSKFQLVLEALENKVFLCWITIVLVDFPLEESVSGAVELLEMAILILFR